MPASFTLTDWNTASWAYFKLNSEALWTAIYEAWSERSYVIGGGTISLPSAPFEVNSAATVSTIQSWIALNCDEFLPNQSKDPATGTVGATQSTIDGMFRYRDGPPYGWYWSYAGADPDYPTARNYTPGTLSHSDLHIFKDDVLGGGWKRRRKKVFSTFTQTSYDVENVGWTAAGSISNGHKALYLGPTDLGAGKRHGRVYTRVTGAWQLQPRGTLPDLYNPGFGIAKTGDIFGPWLLEQIRDAFNRLVWRDITNRSGTNTYADVQRKSATSTLPPFDHQTSVETWDHEWNEVKANAATDFAAAAWITSGSGSWGSTLSKSSPWNGNFSASLAAAEYRETVHGFGAGQAVPVDFAYVLLPPSESVFEDFESGSPLTRTVNDRTRVAEFPGIGTAGSDVYELVQTTTAAANFSAFTVQGPLIGSTTPPAFHANPSDPWFNINGRAATSGSIFKHTGAGATPLIVARYNGSGGFSWKA